MKTALVALMAAACASAAFGQTWAEAGDAGDLPGVAQSTAGAGALTNITGSIGALSDADMYVIYISNPAAFSATTNIAPGTMEDTTLYLFNMNGTGIAKNDDISSANFLSDMPVGNALYSGLTPGYYLLAVAGFAWAPYSTGPTTVADLTFNVNAFTGVQGPQQAGPVLGWVNAGAYSTGTYNITLTGADFVPTPGAAAAFGLAGLAAMRRRR